MNDTDKMDKIIQVFENANVHTIMADKYKALANRRELGIGVPVHEWDEKVNPSAEYIIHLGTFEAQPIHVPEELCGIKGGETRNANVLKAMRCIDYSWVDGTAYTVNAQGHIVGMNVSLLVELREWIVNTSWRMDAICQYDGTDHNYCDKCVTEYE